MSEATTLDAVLIDAIQKTQGAIGEAADFALAQAPDVVQQLLLWAAISEGIKCILSVVILTACCKTVMFIVNYPKPDGAFDKNLIWWGNDLQPAVAVLAPVLIVMSAGLAACLFNLTWLQILIAPKLYLLEYAASLIK